MMVNTHVDTHVDTHDDTHVDTHVDTQTQTDTQTDLEIQTDVQTNSSTDLNTQTEINTPTDAVLASLVATASSWCSSHGVLMAARDRTTGKSLGTDTFFYEPAPFSLHPTPFPTTAFQTAYRMAQPFHTVVHNVASSEWLQQVLAIAAQSDKALTGKLVQLAQDVRNREANGTPRAQRVVLGILRYVP